MKGLYIMLFFFGTGINALAQHNVVKRKGEHSINLSFTPQVYLNKVGSIGHWGDDMEQQVIYPKNTLGYNFGIEYQRITCYRLVLGIGLQAGMQKHDVGVHYNLGYVDEEVPQLKSMAIDTQYAATLHHVGLRLMVGYRLQLSSEGLKGWDILAKGGVTLKQYTTPLATTSQRWMVGYPKNDTLWIKPVGYDDSYFGSGGTTGGGIHTVLNVTLGISKNIDLGFVRSVSITLDVTHALLNNQGGAIYETLDKYDSYTGALINRGNYTYGTKDFALGIRFAVGLWPNIKGQR